MDKFVQLVSKAEFAVCILRNPVEKEFAFVALGPDAAAEQHRLVMGGMRFAGVAGIVDGKPRTAMAVELDDEESSILSQAFLQVCAEEIRAAIGVGSGAAPAWVN